MRLSPLVFGALAFSAGPAACADVEDAFLEIGVGCPSTAPTARLVGASSVTTCVLALARSGEPTSEPHVGGLVELRFDFDDVPGLVHPRGLRLEERLGGALEDCAAAGPFGATTYDGDVDVAREGRTLVVGFSPALPNARTYRLDLGCQATGDAARAVTFRTLAGDASSDGVVDGADRSAVVGVATSGSPFSCATDLDGNGVTEVLASADPRADDRDTVVDIWTAGVAVCAP